MANHLLDTNILILRLRNDENIGSLIANLTQLGTVYISTVTRAEVLAGMRPQQEPKTLALLRSVTSLPADAAIADQAGRWMYHYARRGIQLSLPDAIIAATALLEGLTLVTTNARHFPMPELTVQPV